MSQELQRYIDMWALPGGTSYESGIAATIEDGRLAAFHQEHMDVVGTVAERNNETGRWLKSHMIGIRSDVWRPDKKELARSLKSLKSRRRAELKGQIKRNGRLDNKQSDRLDEQLSDDQIMQMSAGELESRRLVLKLFKMTSSRVRWCGTIEEVTTTEIHNSIGSKRRLLTTAVMLPRFEYVTQIQENHRTYRVPSIFTFGFYDDRRMWHLSFKQRWFSLGVDLDIEADCQRIGKIDGKLVSFGADSLLRLKEHPLTDSTPFVDLVTLFTASVGFHRAMRKSLKRRIKAAKRGESYRNVIEDEELRLRQNGRSAA